MDLAHGTAMCEFGKTCKKLHPLVSLLDPRPKMLAMAKRSQATCDTPRSSDVQVAARDDGGELVVVHRH